MKTALLLILLFSATALFAQPTLKLSQDGIYREVVEMGSKDSTELYRETVKWIGRTYKTPDQVVKSKTENDYIRLDGIHSGGDGVPQFHYSIEFDFKPGKYRITFSTGEFFSPGSGMANWTYSSYFRSDGTQNKPNIRKTERINNAINEIIMSHYNFLTTQEKREDW